MSDDRRPSASIVVLLAGAGLISAFSIRRLPSPRELGRLPATPFDHCDEAAASDFLLFQEAARMIPAGESATPMTEPRDPGRETTLFGMAVALLPGKRVLPSSQWSAFTPGLSSEARYVIVFGRKPAVEPGDPIFADVRGSIWRRKSP